MSLASRLILVNAILAAGAAAHWGLNAHLRAGRGAYAEIRRPIAQVPALLKSGPSSSSVWMGRTNSQEEIIRTQLPFVPNDLLSRTYSQSAAPLAVNLYMVYSRQGDDRKHHPEVCIRDVAGAAEDESARKIVLLANNVGRPVQRFRFQTGPTQNITVYYWHYTFPRVPDEGETALQSLYQRLSKPAPSITVQVSTTAEMDQLDEIETGFLVALDQNMQQNQLPEGTLMGCDRLPIALIRR